MPRARSKIDRVAQVANWLRHRFPVALDVDVRFEHCKDDHGSCTKSGDRFVIVLDPRARNAELLDTLIHEWAHARQWFSAAFLIDETHHPDCFFSEYGGIYRRFHDENGAAESSHYPW
jgi:hypothetical protein